MQRQSLGSPQIAKQQHLPSSPFSSSLSSNNNGGEVKIEEDHLKKLKLKPNYTTKPENYIHLIPVLTLICFLILYFSSHNPLQNDLAQFNGFNRNLPNPADLGENILKSQGVAAEIKSGDLLAIRSLKNVKHEDLKYRRVHRKIAGF